MSQRGLINRVGLGLLVAFTWFVVLLRIQPWPFSDYAVFLSVARRLNAGDVLYEGIWDNKDPFVYYSIALLQDLGQPALWALEALWFVIAAGAVFAISRHSNLTRNWSLLLGGVFTPIVLIPHHYFPGTTHLPGVALTLLTIALTMKNRFLLSGLALGALFFFKLSMLPVAAVGLAVVLMRNRSVPKISTLSIGFAVTLISGAALLAIRRELVPYLASLIHNFTYSQTDTSTGATGPLAVLSERATVLTNIHVLITVGAIALIVAFTASRRRTLRLWDVTAATFATSLLVLLAVGKFPHHAQVLGVSAALSLITLALALVTFRKTKPIVSAAVLLAFAVLLTGLPSLKGYRDALMNPQGTWQAMTTIDPSTKDLLASGPPRTFAIVQGGGLPRSPGLEDWELVCRHIAQRPWESDELLQESLDCFPRAEVILIGKDFAPAADPPAFARFTSSVAQLLDEQYQCVEAEDATVCTRNRSAPQGNRLIEIQALDR